MLDIGQSEDWIALQVALAPCLLGYGAVGKMLHTDPRSKQEGNVYWSWIENYVADDYGQAVATGSGTVGQSRRMRTKRTDARVAELLERHALLQGPSRIEELVKIFIHATKVRVKQSADGDMDSDCPTDGDWLLGDVSAQLR